MWRSLKTFVCQRYSFRQQHLQHMSAGPHLGRSGTSGSLKCLDTIASAPLRFAVCYHRADAIWHPALDAACTGLGCSCSCLCACMRKALGQAYFQSHLPTWAGGHLGNFYLVSASSLQVHVGRAQPARTECSVNFDAPPCLSRGGPDLL